MCYIISGGDQNSKVGVSGDSAGGKLAAIVCHEAKDLVDFAVCIKYNVFTLLKCTATKVQYSPAKIKTPTRFSTKIYFFIVNVSH